ncbi:MAG: APC family permease [Clostridiales bacterium]|uniref:APC family permease n=1 Tax=Evtepia sp. TaxID=2773933 RepID=UPI00298709E4|nr:APC family permease [Evtepia sp.]MDD7288932.1 APC family permease [Clostridiales bacterium]MDY4430930.1 APC family permease [Evtepia sp.]
MSNNPEKKGVSAIDFFCIGFGAIVGVGWAVSINGWMTSCGGPVPAGIGYIVALIMMVPIALCYCELVPMLPVAGGGMAFAYRAFNDKAAVLSGWAAFGAFVAIIPWEAIQITDVLGYLIPGLKSGDPLYEVMGSGIYLTTIIIGTICSLLLFALNMRGLAAAAFVQKILCFVLVGAAVIGAIASLVGGNAGNWQPIYDVSNPEIYGPGLKEVSHSSMMGGIFAILASAPFFLAGFETIPQGVEEAGGDISSVGKTVVLSVSLACIFYAILLFCFGFAWPWQEFAGMERPAAATMFKFLFPGGAGLFLYWLITIGAIAGLFTTWNGFFMASANLLMAMSRGRVMPAIFAKQNKNGIPVPGLVVCLILSLVGPFLGANMIDSITCFSAAAFVLSWALTCWSLIMLRKKEPNLNRPYKIPGGLAMAGFAAIVATVVLICMFIPASPFYVGAQAVKMFIGWLVIGLILYLASSGQRKGMSQEELKHGVFAVLDEK